MLVPMAKVEIIGPKNKFLDVVSLLHNIGTLHIEDMSRKIMEGTVPVDKMEVDETQLKEREGLENQLARVRSVLNSFPESREGIAPEVRDRLYGEHWHEDAQQISKEVGQILEDVESQTSSLATRQAQIDQELTLLAKYEPILHKIQPLAAQIVTVAGFDSVALLIERRYKALLDDLRDELDRITKRQCEIVATDVDADTTAAIVVFNKNYSEQVHKFLAMENVNQVRLPSDMSDKPFDVAYDLVKKKQRELPVELVEIKKQLDDLAGVWRAKLTAIRDVLGDKVSEIGAIPMFGQTEYAFVVTGWLPVKHFADLEKQLNGDFGDDVIVEQLEIGEKDYEETPVALSNPKIVAPYQSVLSALGPPQYGTLDPTWFLAIFYPLFFGMIVGDVGYGLVMLAATLWLRFKYRTNQFAQIATAVFGPAATMAIAFGLVYGEVFGDTLYKMFPHPILLTKTLELPFDRAALAPQLIVVVLAVGFLQVCFGLVVGAINGIRTKHRKHVYEKGGLLIFLVSVAMLVAAGMWAGNVGAKSLGPIALTWVAGIAALVGFVMLIFGGGVMGPIELMESVAHIMSYIRIMAVGLAGAIFATAINKLVGTASATNIVVGILIGVVLHALNIVIAAFSPTIHAFRLNFLEFFQKFYETGKEEYRPFHKAGGG